MSTAGTAVADELDLAEFAVGAEGLVVGFEDVTTLVGDKEGVTDGKSIGFFVSVGAVVGQNVIGPVDGTLTKVGSLVGTNDGTKVGIFVSPETVGRLVDGTLVGLREVGEAVGAFEGLVDGLKVEGPIVGNADGCLLGLSVNNVGVHVAPPSVNELFSTDIDVCTLSKKISVYPPMSLISNATAFATSYAYSWLER